MSIEELISHLGREAMIDRLMISTGAVTEAKSRKILPASWFDALDRLGAEKGVEVPRELFNWKARAKEPS